MSRADSPQWIAAKADGDRAELAIAQWFQSLGWEVFRTIGQVAFDLLLQCAVEVKHDRKAPETGNLAIETEYRGMPSGIITTKASWWVFVLVDKAIVVKKDKLLPLVLSGGFRAVNAGDRGASRVTLVPVERVKQIGQTVALPSMAKG